VTDLGYCLVSELHGPRELVEHARRAEETGFRYALISDHYHPWISTQGHSPFVWGMLGAIAEATSELTVGTGVTCPTVRVHPAIVAQAAATASLLLEGRFFLGVGSGENLNEHILGDRWPRVDVRHDMLEEAVAVMRELWKGKFVTHHGRHYTVEGARVYDPPDGGSLPVYVAGAGPKAATLSGRIGDGLIGAGPSRESVETFESSGGVGKPKLGQVHVCWADSREEGVRRAHELWPNAAIGGELGQELPMPRHVAQAAEMVEPEDVDEVVACGPDPERHLEMIRRFEDAGYTQVYVHQIGPDQEGFFRFYEREILPQFA
jgi:coenzyme F420-dependent glucose-6-phosphate dehydrogenase